MLISSIPGMITKWYYNAIILQFCNSLVQRLFFSGETEYCRIVVSLVIIPGILLIYIVQFFNTTYWVSYHFFSYIVIFELFDNFFGSSENLSPKLIHEADPQSGPLGDHYIHTCHPFGSPYLYNIRHTFI